MLWQGSALGLKIENRGDLENPRISLSVYAEKPLDDVYLESLTQEIRYRYNLDFDLGEFYLRFQDDPCLGAVIQRWRGLRPANFGSLYEYLIIAIVLQNATVRRSVNMLHALLERYGVRLAFDGREMLGFWQPESISTVKEEELRSLKVGYRAKSILRVTQAIVSQQVDELALRCAAYDEQRQALLGLYGIGPASVGYILSDVFHIFDEMNHISPWEQKIYSKLFYNRDPEDPAPVDDLKAYFDEHYSGWRMLAVHYIWEDLFWQRLNHPVDWLEKLIRL